jgi:hypothetical protein
MLETIVEALPNGRQQPVSQAQMPLGRIRLPEDIGPAGHVIRRRRNAAANMFGMRLSVTYEDRAEGQRQLHRLAALDFRVACFGHGKAIIGGAASRFRRRWPVGSGPGRTKAAPTEEEESAGTAFAPRRRK